MATLLTNKPILRLNACEIIDSPTARQWLSQPDIYFILFSFVTRAGSLQQREPITVDIIQMQIFLCLLTVKTSDDLFDFKLWCNLSGCRKMNFSQIVHVVRGLNF